MPIYNFECKNKKCGHLYEDLVSYDETGKYKGVKCPECGSAKKVQHMTACNFMFSNPVGTDRWNSETSGHEYRFKHNIPKVMAERQAAEMASHMGPTGGYNEINDLDNDASWGEVK